MEFRRVEDTFLLSELIKNDLSQEYQNFINYFGLESDINPNLPKKLPKDLKEFLQQLENLVTQEADLHKIEEFNKNFKTTRFSDFNDLNSQITAKSEIGNVIIWQNFWPEKLINSTSEKKQIVELYNFLANFINENQLLRLLSAIKKNPNTGVFEGFNALTVPLAIFNSSNKKEYTPATVLFASERLSDGDYESWLPRSLKDPSFSKRFMTGFSSSGTKHFWFDEFKHEMGHMIMLFFAASKDNQELFGKKMNQNNFNKLLEEQGIIDSLYSKKNGKIEQEKNHRFNDSFNFLETYDSQLSSNSMTFYSKLRKTIIEALKSQGIKFNRFFNVKQKALAYLTALPSSYGRNDIWKFMATKEKVFNEYFAEAFAYWAYTPDGEKNFYWSVFNTFFSDWLGKFKA